MFSQADAYERFMGRWSRLLSPALVNFVQVREGDLVLDVGSGTGALSFALRDATTTARITGVERSAEYVAHVAKEADPRVVFEAGDAEQLRFADGMFDKTLSMLVLNFVSNPARAVKEWIRVTKPGGVVSAAVWDYGEGMQMLRIFWDEATALEPTIGARDEARMPLCRRGELASLWTEQGLTNVQEVPLSITQHFASFEDYWTPFLLGQGPAGDYAAKLPKKHRAELEARLRVRLLGGTQDRAIDLEARAWTVKGAVP